MSSSSPYGEPPAGINIHANRNTTIYGSIIPVACIGTVIVAVRTRLRFLNGKPSFKIDDFTVIMALEATGMPYGLGKHIWVTDITKLVTLWQILYAYIMVYATSVALTNLSILLFYRRIFRFDWSFYLVSFVVCVYWAIIIIVINIGCRPLPYFWTRFGDPNAVGTCIDIQAFFFSNAIWALVTDIVLLVMPIPTVMRLQMPLGERLAVITILMLGGFVCIACILRIISLKQFLNATDLTWAMAPVFVWSCVEPFVGLICACLPTFGPYYRKWWSKMHSTLSGGKSAPYTHGQPGTDGYNARSKDTLRTTRGKRLWGSLHGTDVGNLTFNGRLRDDDEVELTTEIVGGAHGSMRTISEEHPESLPDRGIQVKEEFVWTSEPTK
ncbi:integral membrane protein [Neofusicoccum parvum]|nr:integral membrane protein [Neofusicoccum parvum]